METVTIARRYRGPLDSANGGYAAGLLAGGSAPREVTLRLPPPLERPLVVRRAGESLVLEDGAPSSPRRAPRAGLEVPSRPRLRRGRRGGGRRRWGPVEFAECFVCGSATTERPRIHPGLVPGRDGSSRRRGSRASVARGVWAAIDCPGAYATGDPDGAPVVLGRMTARLDRLPDEGEQCVVAGWPLGVDGRKLFAGTALFGRGGELLARARQVWIAPRPA